jgi:hypothetical protein
LKKNQVVEKSRWLKSKVMKQHVDKAVSRLSINLMEKVFDERGS